MAKRIEIWLYEAVQVDEISLIFHTGCVKCGATERGRDRQCSPGGSGEVRDVYFAFLLFIMS